MTDRVCDGICDGVWLFGKDSFKECPLTLGLLEGGSSSIDLDKLLKKGKRKKGGKEKGKKYVFCSFCAAYSTMI